MRAALAGDGLDYRRLLEELGGRLRAWARRQCARAALPAGDAEDLVQEVLLAIHLKRGTWDQDRPIGPWIAAIARNKLIDALRRRGRSIQVPLDDVVDTLAADERPDGLERHDVARMLERLKEPQRRIVRSIAMDGAAVREVAAALGMSEGAVRVALHRALKTLARLFRDQAP